MKDVWACTGALPCSAVRLVSTAFLRQEEQTQVVGGGHAAPRTSRDATAPNCYCVACRCAGVQGHVRKVRLIARVEFARDDAEPRVCHRVNSGRQASFS